MSILLLSLQFSLSLFFSTLTGHVYIAVHFTASAPVPEVEPFSVTPLSLMYVLLLLLLRGPPTTPGPSICFAHCFVYAETDISLSKLICWWCVQTCIHLSYTGCGHVFVLPPIQQWKWSAKMAKSSQSVSIR